MINNILPHTYIPRSVRALKELQNTKKSSINFVPKTSAINNEALKEMVSSIKTIQNNDVSNLK